jgi:NADPH-dependent curcumin reductase CurA
MPGMTAYMGLLDIGQPAAGVTVVVAAPSGPVGSVVGQIAKLKGCHVVGIAGGKDKCRYVIDELGFDFCIDHHEDDLPGHLAAACPKGIDVYFESVGGAVFDAVLPLLNTKARIPVCGLVADYNTTALPPGPDRLEGSGPPASRLPPEQRRPPEFGSDKDFPLIQALNQLKGRQVMVSKTQAPRTEAKKEN